MSLNFGRDRVLRRAVRRRRTNRVLRDALGGLPCPEGEQGSAIEKLLIWLSVPVVLLITLQALIGKAYARLGRDRLCRGTILAVWLLHQRRPKGLRVSFAIQRHRQRAVSLPAIFVTS